MKTIYGLVGRGDSINGWKFNMRSKTLFLSKTNAEHYIPKFTERCCDKTEFECADPDTLKISVTEYELDES